MNRERFFTCIMDICDWDKLGDDEQVLMPLINHLSQLPDEEIFDFEDIMSELLYELDTRKNYKTARKFYSHNDDTFLYSRCVALVNGEVYYEKVKAGKIKDLWKNEFESILYVPREAWAKKHGKNMQDFPHISPQSYETGSNTEAWK